MNEQQADNLRILIRHMERNVTRTLNMSRYVDCGTPACALGEAGCIPHFQAQGWHIQGNDLLHGDGLYVHDIEATFGMVYERLFSTHHLNLWQSSNVTPRAWADGARTVLAEYGYSMDDPAPADDGFSAFMAKVREPVAVESVS